MVNNKKNTMTSGANVKKIIPGEVKKIVPPVMKKASLANTQKNNVKKEVAKVESPLQEVRIKKLGILSVATTFAIIGIIIGLILTIILIPLYSLLSPLLVDLGLPGIFSNFWIAFLLIPLFVISCFIFGVIFSLFYNLAALITKGIKLFS